MVITCLGQVKRELEEEDLGPEGDGGRIDEDMVSFGYTPSSNSQLHQEKGVWT